MSDETQKTDQPTPGTDGGSGVTDAPKTFTQDDLERIINRKFAKLNTELDEVRADRDKLAQAENERKEAEMDELEKANAKIAELTGQVDQLTPYKLQADAREEAAADKVEELAKDLSEDQKAIMESIGTNEAKVRYIEQIKSVQANRPSIPPGGKPQINGITMESIQQKKAAGDPSWRDDYAQYRKVR